MSEYTRLSARERGKQYRVALPDNTVAVENKHVDLDKISRKSGQMFAQLCDHRLTQARDLHCITLIAERAREMSHLVKHLRCGGVVDGACACVCVCVRAFHARQHKLQRTNKYRQNKAHEEELNTCRMFSVQAHIPAFAGVRRLVVGAESGNLGPDAVFIFSALPARTRSVGARSMPRCPANGRRPPRAGAEKASAVAAAAARPNAAIVRRIEGGVSRLSVEIRDRWGRGLRELAAGGPDALQPDRLPLLGSARTVPNAHWGVCRVMNTLLRRRGH